MSFLKNIFSKKVITPSPLKWDMHNHLLFGIDDGSATLEYSVEMAKIYVSLGYSKITSTPHILSDFYPNTGPIIQEKRDALQNELNHQNIPLTLDFAAEYYIDDSFVKKIKEKEQLLTFEGNHVLIESGFMNMPRNLHEVIFDLQTSGYVPVLAHPERYTYFQTDFSEAERIFNTGVKFQINLLAFVGYYSPMAKKLADWLVSKNYYHFLGTDAHSTKHLNLVPTVWKTKSFSKIDWTRVENANL